MFRQNCPWWERRRGMHSIYIDKITDPDLILELSGVTSGKDVKKLTPTAAYRSEHSPIRSQMFKVKMVDIPSYCSVHFRTHSIGVQHFVKSNRMDRGGDPNAGRMTPVNHTMLINAQGLIDMSKLRLCGKADSNTRMIMQDIRDAMQFIDKPLAKFMVPKCVYRNGICGESPSCGSLNWNLQVYGEGYLELFTMAKRYEKKGSF
jgi:hypothetical protein